MLAYIIGDSLQKLQIVQVYSSILYLFPNFCFSSKALLESVDNVLIKSNCFLMKDFEIPPTESKYWQVYFCLISPPGALASCLYRINHLGTQQQATKWASKSSPSSSFQSSPSFIQFCVLAILHWTSCCSGLSSNADPAPHHWAFFCGSMSVVPSVHARNVPVWLSFCSLVLVCYQKKAYRAGLSRSWQWICCKEENVVYQKSSKRWEFIRSAFALPQECTLSLCGWLI